MRIYIVDNYDSFTYNLVHYIEEFNVEVFVSKNDQINWAVLSKSDAILLSPGPGLPDKAGELLKVIEIYHTSKPIFGVCLGMQALAMFFGDELKNQQIVKHGVAETISIVKSGVIFEDIASPTTVGLYHSWKVCFKENSPFIPTSFSESNVLMSFEHKYLPIYGVQFHPESIMTVEGKKMIKNFINSVE